jgi:hypothetical protein
MAVFEQISAVALDIIGICGFGTDFEATEKDSKTKNEFQQASTDILEEVGFSFASICFWLFASKMYFFAGDSSDVCAKVARYN